MHRALDMVKYIHFDPAFWKYEGAQAKIVVYYPRNEVKSCENSSSPNLHCKGKMSKIQVSVSVLYIPTMGLPFLLEEICGPILGIYKSLTDT
jgi:hypothetical protein